MNIWLRESGCEGYVMRTVDSLDGLKYDETGNDGIPCYSEMPNDDDGRCPVCGDVLENCPDYRRAQGLPSMNTGLV